jgi:hypothetical protein
MGAHPAAPVVPNLDLTKEQNFSFPRPTEFVDLPSQGKFYPEDHPLHGQESLEIRFMTAKDEDTLSSQALLRKGLALDRFLQDIIIDKSVKVEDLLVCDKNALIVKARITGYGPEYETTITCPSCTSKVNYTFDLEDLETVTADEIEEAGYPIAHDGTFEVVLPKSGAPVKLRLITGKEEKRLVAKQRKSQIKKTVDRSLTDQLKTIIVEVAGSTDRHVITHFVDNMPAIDSKFIRKHYALRTPKIDMSTEFVCEECAYETVLEVPLSVDFFWPGQ